MCVCVQMGRWVCLCMCAKLCAVCLRVCANGWVRVFAQECVAGKGASGNEGLVGVEGGLSFMQWGLNGLCNHAAV